MRRKLQNSFLILFLIFMLGCSSVSTDNNWQPLGWEENIPSIEPKFEKPFEPIFQDYPPLKHK